MSEHAFTWNLTPTERRIAEMAFASAGNASGAHMAITRVLELRGLPTERRHYYQEGRDGWYEAMLAELRRVRGEDECAVCDVYRSHAKTWRTLLERIVKSGGACPCRWVAIRALSCVLPSKMLARSW